MADSIAYLSVLKRLGLLTTDHITTMGYNPLKHWQSVRCHALAVAVLLLPL